MAVHPTYKNLKAGIPLGPFTFSQWGQVVVATVCALVFGFYLSPFPPGPTIFAAILLAGLPVAVSYGAMAQDWSVLDAARAQWRWLTHPRRHVPGPSDAGTGYVVVRPAETEDDNDARTARTQLTQERGGLWDY